MPAGRKGGDSGLRPLRVVHCLEQIRSGGVERRRLSLARRLDGERFEQIVICTEADWELAERFCEAGCQVHQVGALRHGLDLRPIRRAARIMRQFRPDIVHGAVYEGVIVASLAGRLARVPVIIAEETIAPTSRRLTGHVYYRLLTAMADKVVAISKAVENYLVRSIGLPRAKVRLIYNGVAEPEAAARRAVAGIRGQFAPAGGPLLGTLSRLASSRGLDPDSHKRISDAIRALAAIRARHGDAQLMIVGDGPARPHLEKLAADLGLGDCVRFAGFQPDPRPFLEAMDVLILASASEGLPLNLVEGMFAARPIVATDVAGSNEVVIDGKTGFLVPLGRPDLLAGKIVELLEDPALARAMGEAGRERARQCFSEHRYVAEIAALYEELAMSPRRK